MINLAGLVIGFVIFIIGGVLVGITKLATVDPNPYKSAVSTYGVIYGVLFAAGFVIFVTFLNLMYESRLGK